MDILSIDELVAYLQNNKSISVSESDKRKLKNTGYYHTSKGYRFVHTSGTRLSFSSFDQLLSVYDFDMRLKACLYLPLMNLETAIKNHTLDEMLTASSSNLFTEIYEKVLNRHKAFPKTSRSFKDALKKELAFRNQIYSNMSRDYGRKQAITHFYENDAPVPFWAIMEILSLGELGTMLSCLNTPTAQKIAASIGINSAFDADGRMLEKIVFALKDLRNAVAHNDPVFDVRFKTSNLSQNISRLLSQETGIVNIWFDTIVDYVILVAYLMRCFDMERKQIIDMIMVFSSACEELRKSVCSSTYMTIVHSDTRKKLNTLLQFVQH